MPQLLYFDVETIPDYSRTDLFTPKVPPPPVTATEEEALEWTAREGSRVLSTQAEYCTMVGLNFALDEDEPKSAWAGDYDNNGEPITERTLLEAFWTLAPKVKALVGYNCLRFDLNVILTRSAFLNIEPTRAFHNVKPWEDTVIDLMKRRFQYAPSTDYMTLKELRRILQLPISDEYRDAILMDGGSVEELYLQALAGDADAFTKLKLYGRLDIVTTRELARFWSGFYFPHLVARR